MRIELAPAAVKSLAKMPAKERAALIEKIQTFAAGGTLTPKVLKAFSPATGRIRHGDWRVVYRIDADTDTLFIEAAAHRREVYE